MKPRCAQIRFGLWQSVAVNGCSGCSGGPSGCCSARPGSLEVSKQEACCDGRKRRPRAAVAVNGVPNCERDQFSVVRGDTLTEAKVKFRGVLGCKREASPQLASPCEEQSETADLLDEAQRCFEATLYNDAWKKYRRVLAMRPADKRAIIGLVQVEAIFEREKVERRRKDRLLLMLAAVFATLIQAL